jgi:hypothetical protein
MTRPRPVPLLSIAVGTCLLVYLTFHSSRRKLVFDQQFESGEIDKDTWAVDQAFLPIEAGGMAILALALGFFGGRSLLKARG